MAAERLRLVVKPALPRLCKTVAGNGVVLRIQLNPEILVRGEVREVLSTGRGISYREILVA